MDPNATLNELVTLIEDGDRVWAAEAAYNLAEWVRGGGFMPKIDAATFDFLLTTLADRLRK